MLTGEVLWEGMQRNFRKIQRFNREHRIIFINKCVALDFTCITFNTSRRMQKWRKLLRYTRMHLKHCTLLWVTNQPHRHPVVNIIRRGNGFPCFESVEVLEERLGSLNLHMYVDKRKPTSTWVIQYKDITFTLPCQSYIDRNKVEEQRQAAYGDNIDVPVKTMGIGSVSDTRRDLRR